MVKKSGKSGYTTNLSEYAGGCTSMELLHVLKNSLDNGKKVFVVIDSDVNELKVSKESLAPIIPPEHAGPYVFGFKTTKAERKIVL